MQTLLGRTAYQCHESIIILRFRALVLGSCARSAHARVIGHLEVVGFEELVRYCVVLLLFVMLGLVFWLGLLTWLQSRVGLDLKRQGAIMWPTEPVVRSDSSASPSTFHIHYSYNNLLLCGMQRRAHVTSALLINFNRMIVQLQYYLYLFLVITQRISGLLRYIRNTGLSALNVANVKSDTFGSTVYWLSRTNHDTCSHGDGTSDYRDQVVLSKMAVTLKK